MNKIRIGKIIRNFLLIISFILVAFVIITCYIYEKNIKMNMQGTDEILNNIGIHNVLVSQIPEILALIGLIGFIIMVIGNTIGIFMCRCPKCGESVLGRGLSIHKYCIKCGEKIEY